MRGVACVLAGFGWGVLHDIAAYRSTPYVKPILLLLALGSHIAGAFLLLAGSPRVRVSSPLRRLTAVISITAFVGMLYSIAVEIPFRRAWIDKGHTSDIVTTGTYSVSRHPGVLWASVWIPTAAIASGSRDLIRWWPLLLAADIAHVWFQDRYVLPRVFGDAYRRYQRQVPFLLPRFSRTTPRSRRPFGE